MRKVYHVEVVKTKDDNTEKYRKEFFVWVDDHADWDNRVMIRMCIVFKAESLHKVFKTFEIPKSDDESLLVKQSSMDLRDYFRRDNPDITVTEIDILDTKKYHGRVQKRDVQGDLEFEHHYLFWVSNSGYPSHPRVYTAIGPEVADLKGTSFIDQGVNEAKYLEQLLKSWHADADTVELVQE